jgi:hypothetical protein
MRKEEKRKGSVLYFVVHASPRPLLEEDFM